MKYTANTKLNQWEKTDRILMSDFNSDNQKLEAAMAKLAGEDTSIRQSIAALQAQIDALTARTVPTLLKEYTTTKTTDMIELDMTFIDWAAYKEIIIEARLFCSAKTSLVKFSWDGRNYPLAEGYATAPSDTTSREAKTPNLLILSACGDKDHMLHVRALASGKIDTSKTFSISGAQLETLNVHSSDTSGTMAAGCKFKFYGIRI